MARPTGLHATVEDYYDRLPGFYREFDVEQTNADGTEESTTRCCASSLALATSWARSTT